MKCKSAIKYIKLYSCMCIAAKRETEEKKKSHLPHSVEKIAIHERVVASTPFFL